MFYTRLSLVSHDNGRTFSVQVLVKFYTDLAYTPKKAETYIGMAIYSKSYRYNKDCTEEDIMRIIAKPFKDTY